MNGLTKNPFVIVTGIFRAPEKCLEAANAADKAYADATGGTHTPFGLDQPETLATNVAGLFAVDSAANALACMWFGLDSDGRVDPDNYVTTLQTIMNDGLSPIEKYVVMNFANATWRAGQPFRNMATKPLDRLTRPVNMQFNELPPNEQAKDWVQIAAAAKFLLEKIESAQS